MGRIGGLPLLLGIIAASISSYLVANIPLLNSAEEQLVTLRTFPPAEPNPKIEVISISDATIKRLAAPGQTLIPRSWYAELIDRLKAAGAKVLLLDIWFKDERAEDRRLTDSLRTSAPLKVTLLTDGDAKDDVDNLDGDWCRFHFPIPSIAPQPLPNNIVIGNGRSFQISDKHFGAILLRHDLDSNRVSLHTSLLGTLQLLDIDPSTVSMGSNDMLTAGPLEWRIELNHEILAHWTKTLEDFPELELTRAIEVLRTKEGRQRYRDKLVILGNVADEEDKYEIGNFGRAPGVRLITQLANTLLERQSRRLLGVPLTGNLMIWFWLACIAASAVLLLRPLMSVSIVSLLAIAAWYLPYWMAHRNIDIAMLPPALAVLLSTFMAMGVRSLIGPADDVRFSGTDEECSVLFVDIRDSTGLTNRLGAKRYRVVHTQLNRASEKILLRHGGSIERTTGDGFIAIFRSTKSHRHALECVTAAREILGKLDRINRESRFEEPLTLSMGIESGIITGGYIREGGRRAWSSAGNTVIMAQRLQSACTEFGVSLLVGPVAARLIEDEVPVHMIARRIFKGFLEESDVFCLTLTDPNPNGEDLHA